MAKYLRLQEFSTETTRKFGEQGLFHLTGIDGLHSELSQVFVAPVAVRQPLRPTELRNTIVAGIYVTNATPEASLQDGFYTLRVTNEGNSPVAELVSNGSVVKKAHTTRLIPTAAVTSQPEAVVVEVASAVIFLAGVIAGMALVVYIQK